MVNVALIVAGLLLIGGLGIFLCSGRPRDAYGNQYYGEDYSTRSDSWSWFDWNHSTHAQHHGGGFFDDFDFFGDAGDID